MSDEKDPFAEFRGLVASIRIDHSDYKMIFERLKEGYEDVGHAATPVCMHIIGESRTGKSCVVTDFLDRYRPVREVHGMRRTVVYAIVPEKATVKALLQQLLQSLKDPHWTKGTEANMTQRLNTLLLGVGCRLIILDEFQHLCDKGQKMSLQHSADWLKILVESKQWGLVALGMPESTSVISTNAQLAGRFDASMTMPLFNWGDTNSRQQFKGILKAFSDELRPFEVPKLDSDEMGLRMYLASAGRVGLFAKLMDRAVNDAIRRRSFKIRIEDLAKAFQTAIWFAPRFPLEGGPFLAKLDLCQGQGIASQVLAIARQEAYADNSAKVSVVTMGGEGKGLEGSDWARVGKMTKKGLTQELGKAF